MKQRHTQYLLLALEDNEVDATVHWMYLDPGNTTGAHDSEIPHFCLFPLSERRQKHKVKLGCNIEPSSKGRECPWDSQGRSWLRTSFSDSRKGKEWFNRVSFRAGVTAGKSSPATYFIRAKLRTIASRIRRPNNRRPKIHGPPKVYTNSSKAV